MSFLTLPFVRLRHVFILCTIFLPLGIIFWLYFRAKNELDTHVAVVESFTEFCDSLDKKMVCRFVHLAHLYNYSIMCNLACGVCNFRMHWGSLSVCRAYDCITILMSVLLVSLMLLRSDLLRL